MNYKIEAVSDEVRKYESKYGPMISYRVKFSGNEQAIEIARKETSPAPKVGDELEGTIDMSSQYGPKFKQEYSPKQGPSGGYGGSKPSGDQFTMYLSYAKDLVVAQIEAGTKIPLSEAIELTLGGGHRLYDGRPGVQPEQAKLDVVHEPTNDDLEQLKDVFKEDNFTVEGEPESPWKA